jgi:hypothetical protein
MPTSQRLLLNSKNRAEEDTIIINQNDNEEELRQIMKEICVTIGENLYKFKSEFKKSEQILQQNYYKNENNEYYMNSNFEEIELIEENLDKLFYNFYEIKKEITKARLVNHYIEMKVIENINSARRVDPLHNRNF